MKIETVTLPTYWASALINGDYSGCSDAEENDINAWIANNPELGPCLSCSDYPELTIFDNLITECLAYSFPVIGDN